MKRWAILGISLLTILATPSWAVPDFKATPEEVAESFVASYRAAATPEQALLELFGIPAGSLHDNDFLKHIKNRGPGDAVTIGKVEKSPAGDEATIGVSETLTSGSAVGQITLQLLKTDQGWWLSDAHLTGPAQDNIDRLIGLAVLHRAGARLDERMEQGFEKGEGNFLDLTPLEHIVAVWQTESSPLFQACKNQPPQRELETRAEELRYLGDRLSLYRARESRWPADLKQVFGAELYEQSSLIKTVRLEPSADGTSLRATLPSTGYPLLGIPKDYPKVEVSQDGAVILLYR